MVAESTGVLLWWWFLAAVSVLNVCFWTLVVRRTLRDTCSDDPELRSARRWLILLSALFVAGCAFRSFLPRSEGSRICLHDHWLSSAVITRAAATIAELSLVAQWALVLSRWAREEGATAVAVLARLLLPLIVVAEAWSWYTTLTTNFLGSVIEESIWAVTATLVTPALLWLCWRSTGERRRFIGAGALILVAYVAFMCAKDIPMYLTRWRSDEASGAQYFSMLAGLVDAHTRSIVTRGWEDWRDEIPWMSFYFTVGVWISITLVRAPLRPCRALQARRAGGLESAGAQRPIGAGAPARN